MTDETIGGVERVLSRREVAALLGVSIPTLWRLVRAKKFPPPIRISPGRVGWLASTVRRWLADRGSDGASRSGGR